MVRKSAALTDADQRLGNPRSVGGFVCSSGVSSGPLCADLSRVVTSWFTFRLRSAAESFVRVRADRQNALSGAGRLPHCPARAPTAKVRRTSTAVRPTTPKPSSVLRAGDTPVVAHRDDDLMSAAVALAGQTIPRAPRFRERLLDDALESALTELGEDIEVVPRRHLPLVGWESLKGAEAPRSREADLQVRRAGAEFPFLVSEQKIDDLSASVFDAAKLLSFGRLPSVRSTYLVAAATPRTFAGTKPGRPLFHPGRRRWSLAELVAEAWQSDWLWHLGAAKAAPRELPETFETELVHTTPVVSYPPHELRCVRISSGTDTETAMVILSEGRLAGDADRSAHSDGRRS